MTMAVPSFQDIKDAILSGSIRKIRDFIWQPLQDASTDLTALAGAMIRKGTVTTNADFPTLALVQIGWTYRVTAIVTDNNAAKTNTGLVFAADELIVWNGTTWIRMTQAMADHLVNVSNPHVVTKAQIGLTVPLDYKGTVTANTDFPLLADVKAGWTYRTTAAVTDNDATKTNSGVAFAANELIVWTAGPNWERLNQTPVLHGSSHIGGASDAIPVAVSGGAAGLMAGADKASLDSLVTEGAGFWSDTADGAIGVGRFVEIDGAGDLVAGSVGSDSVVGAGLNAAPVVGTDPIVVGIGKRSLVAADAILAGQELKCGEAGMAISAVTTNNGLASAAMGGGAGIEYTNQPANDQITIESSDALDIGVPITIIGTTNGGVVVVEEILATDGADGTTPVDSVKVDWGLILAVKKPATLGTITLKEKSGGLTIRVVPLASTTDAVIAVAAGNQQAYNAKPEFAAEAATTKVIGFKRIATTGTTETYEGVTLNGTAKQKPATASRRVTELYVGDLEAARTLAVTTTATADAQEIRTGRAYSAAAARGDTISAIVRP
jgi:hypothetical protein